MKTEFGDRSNDQPQQGDATDLTTRYRAIGIPALTAATLCKPKKPAQDARQQQGMIFDFED
jgi:hypothetical protein